MKYIQSNLPTRLLPLAELEVSHGSTQQYLHTFRYREIAYPACHNLSKGSSIPTDQV